MSRPHEVVIKVPSGAAARRVERAVERHLFRGAHAGAYGMPEMEVRDVTPCAERIHHGPGGQSTTTCAVTGRHETTACGDALCPGRHEVHGASIMGCWEEWFVDCFGVAREF